MSTNKLQRDFVPDWFEKEVARINEPYDKAVIVEESITKLLQYLVASFSVGYERYSIESCSVRRSNTGTFRGVIRATRTTKAGVTTGHVAFTEGDSFEECLALMDTALEYGVLEFRIDKYFKTPESNRVDRKKSFFKKKN